MSTEEQVQVAEEPEQYVPHYTRLGRGTYGEVKLATHMRTGHVVALKYTFKPHVNIYADTAAAQREAEVCNMMRHPHIVGFYESYDTVHATVLVLEYLPLGTLDMFVRDIGALDDESGRRFFQEIISGISYFHGMNIIHRDIKLENIFIDLHYHAKIGDFGLGRTFEPWTEGKGTGKWIEDWVGTPQFAAPEILLRKRYRGPEVDVWSTGVVLYSMVSGRLPFPQDKRILLEAAITQGIYIIPPDLSLDIARLISSMLTVPISKRITIPQIMEHSFYTTNLPPYLAREQYARTQPHDYSEREAVRAVSKIVGVKPSVVQTQLGGKDKEITLLYHMLRDQRRFAKNLVDLADDEWATKQRRPTVMWAVVYTFPSQLWTMLRQYWPWRRKAAAVPAIAVPV